MRWQIALRLLFEAAAASYLSLFAPATTSQWSIIGISDISSSLRERCPCSFYKKYDSINTSRCRAHQAGIGTATRDGC